MTKARDSQRIKVYRAEWEIKKTSPLGWGKSDNVRKFVTKVLTSAYVTRRYGKLPIPKIEPKHHGRATYSGYWQRIELPRWAMTKETVLHEVAHHIVHWKYGSRCAGHGPEFVKVFLELLSHFISKEHAKQIQSLYAQQGVKTLNASGKAVKVRMPAGMEEFANSTLPKDFEIPAEVLEEQGES